jgi:hypothetical protein
MRFYTQAHEHYCGIDLHAKTMYVCVVNQQGDMLLHQNINTDSEHSWHLLIPIGKTWWSPSSASLPGTGWPLGGSLRWRQFVQNSDFFAGIFISYSRSAQQRN